MLIVRCDGCGAEGRTSDGADPDSAVTCGCCPAGHHHGRAASACPGHDGPCGKGTPGCAVCRPVTITATATLRGSVT